MKRKTVLTAAVVFAAASPLLLPGAGNAAPAPAAPAGCTDILASLNSTTGLTGTNARWDRLVQSVKQTTTNATLGYYGKAVVTYQARGVVDAFFALDAPSCADVTYVATFSSADGTTTYATLTGHGDGVSKVLHLEGVLNGTDASTIGARLSTVDSRGRTIDTIGSGSAPAQVSDDDGGAGANFA